MNSNSRKIGLCCALAAGLAFVDFSARAGEVPAGSNDEGQTVGYFPTFVESDMLTSANMDYTREIGGPLSGPDLDRWGATGGIWPYEYQAGRLNRMQRFLQPVDYILQPLTPGEGYFIQGPTSNSWLQMGGSFPFLSRTYHPERSTFADVFGMDATQYSPFFFDLLSVSFIALYVDASGPGFEATGLDDGFISALSFDIRAGWNLTDRTSLLVAGQVYFVFSDDSDVQAYLDMGQLGAFASLNLQEQVGSWDLRIYDDLIPFSGRRLFFDETYSGEIQQAGHYWVGISDATEDLNYFDSRSHYLLNTAGFTAGTFVGNSLRFLLGAARMDSWLMNDFDEHGASEYLSAGLFYDGYDLWLAPSLTYTAQTQDFDNLQNILTLNAVAPISPNITLNGGVGYGWGDAYEGWQWNVGLQHQLTDRFRHSLSYSSGYQDVLIGDDFIGSRFDYGFSYNITGRAYLAGYAGLFEAGDNSSDALSLGLSFNFALGDYSWFRALVGYMDSDDNSFGTGGGESWIYSVSLSRRLAERLNGELLFEYYDNGVANYEESVVMLRLTRSF